jgi:hypothetical protein
VCANGVGCFEVTFPAALDALGQKPLGFLEVR